MKKLSLIPDTSKGVGLGHIYRLLALNEILQSQFKIEMVISSEAPFQIQDINPMVNVISVRKLASYSFNSDGIILDGYRFTDDEIDHFKSFDIPIIEISDFRYQLYDVDFWINSSLGSRELGKGLEYCLLRKGFLDAAQSIEGIGIAQWKFFVGYGGTDESGSTLTTVKSLVQFSQTERINVIYPSNGSDYSPLKKLSEEFDFISLKSGLGERELVEFIEEVDICIVSASTIACECVAMRKTVLASKLFPNQDLLHRQLIEAQAVLDFIPNEFCQNPMRYLGRAMDQSVREQQFQSQRRLIDGNSGHRLLKLVKSILYV